MKRALPPHPRKIDKAVLSRLNQELYVATLNHRDAPGSPATTYPPLRPLCTTGPAHIFHAFQISTKPRARLRPAAYVHTCRHAVGCTPIFSVFTDFITSHQVIHRQSPEIPNQKTHPSYETGWAAMHWANPGHACSTHNNHPPPRSLA